MDAKAETRIKAFEAVQGSALLWSETSTCLRYDWMELADTGATCELLVAKKTLSGPGRFIGVDRDPQKLAVCHSAYPNEHWYAGELIPLLRTDEFPRVGVLVFDSWRSAKGQKTILPDLDVIADFTLRQYRRIGEFLLVLNVAADQRWVKPHHIDEYCAAVSERLKLANPLTQNALHRYVSSKTPMLWSAIRFGF